MTSPAMLYIDGIDSRYGELRLPAGWGCYVRGERGGIGVAMNWAFTEFPNETSYGWLADDLRPRTKGFDKKLEEAAGDWNFACSADDWYSLDFHLSNLVRKGHDMCGALCWGGDLVRAAGSWAFLQHVGIDAAWCLVNSRLGNARYCADVMVEHLQYRNGKRLKDSTDEITVPETKYYQDGIIALRDFNAGGHPDGPMMQIVARIQAKMGDAIAQGRALDEPWWQETT